MSKLIKKAIAIVLAVCSFLFVVDTTITAITFVETMRISGEISTALACIIGGLSGISLVLLCGVIFTILTIAIDRINNNKSLVK